MDPVPAPAQVKQRGRRVAAAPAGEQRAALGIVDRPTVVVERWQYAGQGYTPAKSLIAASVREGGDAHGA